MHKLLIALFIAVVALFGEQATAQTKPVFPPGSFGEKIVQRGTVIVGGAQ